MEREEAERLVARYGPSVYRLAYARTGSKEDAEDVMQETFLRLVRAAPEFRDEEHGKAWLLRVATHCAEDVFRMPWRKRDLPLEAARGVSSAPPKEPDSNVLAAVLSLPGLRYAVTSNGATIRDLVEQRVLLEKHLAPALCLQVLARCAHIPMIRQVFRAGVGYLSRPDYETLRARYAGTAMLQYHLDTRQVLPGTVEEFLAADARPVEELFFLTDSPQTKQALRQCLADLPGIGFADPFPNDLEVIAGEIDKGEALRYLLDRLDIAPEEVLAMGDGGSDLPLLQAAGIGVAMGNATEAVKAGADFVTASCEADGVALAIEKFVLSEGETL